MKRKGRLGVYVRLPKEHVVLIQKLFDGVSYTQSDTLRRLSVGARSEGSSQ